MEKEFIRLSYQAAVVNGAAFLVLIYRLYMQFGLLWGPHPAHCGRGSDLSRLHLACRPFVGV